LTLAIARSPMTAAAPAATAAVAWAWPSVSAPGTATNRSPALTRRESKATPLIDVAPTGIVG